MIDFRKFLMASVITIGLTVDAVAELQPGDPEYVNITPNNPAIEIGDEYSDWAYSAEFARRFKLDKSNVEDMSQGLLAVEFRIERSEKKELAYECYLNLFLNDRNNIQFPETRESGDFKTIDHINNSLPFLDRNDNDRKFYIDDENYLAYGVNSKIIEPFSSDFEMHGRLIINSYRKYAFNNIHYISLKVQLCETILPPKYGYDVIFRKEGIKKYQPDFTRNDVTRIPVPIALHKRICPYVEKAAHESLNAMLINISNLRNLYKLSKEKMNNYPLGCK